MFYKISNTKFVFFLEQLKYNLNRDWNGGPLERLVRANIRVPDQTIGDFNAQFAANHIGAGRVKELCAKYGADTVLAAMDGQLDYSERRMRAAIRAVPDGVYHKKRGGSEGNNDHHENARRQMREPSCRSQSCEV